MTLPRPAKPSSDGRKRFTVPTSVRWLLLAALVLAIGVVALAAGRDISSRSGAKSQAQTEGQGQLQAAAAILDLPTGTGVPETPVSTETVVATVTDVSASATAIIATHVAYATDVAEFRDNLRTSIALT